MIEEAGLKCVIKGTGDTVHGQLPEVGTVISTDGVIIIYSDDASISANVSVPNVMNDTPANAIKKLINANLNVSISGIFNGDHNNCRVIAQSVKAGEYVLPGTVIEIEFLYEEDIE